MRHAIVQKNAFVFCRYSVTAMVWLALLLHSAWVLVAVFVILTLSAVLTVRRAPMIVLWTWTLGRVIPSEEVALDVEGMRFAHGLGAALAFASLAMVWHHNPAAWWLVVVFALVKTVSAFGWCPAEKLYRCLLQDGGC